jgi:endonuclease YncB( thermonuclease family)
MSPGWLALLLVAQSVVVTDGDTIKLDGERVRLLAIDAPEIFSPQCRSEKRRGEAAKIELERLVAGRTLTLERHGTDRYRRTLAIVFAGGVNLNDAMIASGHAVRWDGHKHDWCTK